MNAEDQRQVSIAIPQLTGGGAEKLTMNLARLLQQDGMLARVYAGSTAGAEAWQSAEVVDLSARRALVALRRFGHAVRGDPANSFLLTLGYVNLAPVLRLKRRRARIVARIGNTATPELKTLGRLGRLRYKAGLWSSLQCADAIVVQSDYMGQDLARLLPAVRPKLTTIYNFIEDELWDYRPASAPPIAGRYLFTAATFKPQKAYEVLLAAYAQSPARVAGVRLVAAGIAPGHEGFKALMGVNGLSSEEVIRPGFVAPYDWIAHAELCVLASHYEGFSNFLLECAALGKRIAATDCPGGNAELFAHYPNAVTVAPGDVLGLAEALGSARHDLDRTEARKHLQVFEQNQVYGRYRALLTGTEAKA